MTFLHYLALRLLGEPCCTECWSWHCPRCTDGPDDFPTLIIEPDAQAWHCERCGQTGNEVALVEQYCRVPAELVDTVLGWMRFVYQREVVHPVSAVLDEEKDIDMGSLEAIVDRIQEHNGERY
jgi:hypothetical protein